MIRALKHVVIRSFYTNSYLLAGHSKWANIRHIKAEKDGQKSALFTKLARQIRLAAQEGGWLDPTLNSQLKAVIDEALRKNMPMSSIQNTIKKFDQNGAQLKRYTLEIRYKQKVFLICVLYTDNLAGLKMELAPILRKNGASLIDASHMFESFGLVEAIYSKTLEASDPNFEEIALRDAIECGAEEVDVSDSTTKSVNFICDPLVMQTVRREIEKKGYLIENTEHVYKALKDVQLNDEEKKAYNVFLQKLRNFKGIEDFYDNVESA